MIVAMSLCRCVAVEMNETLKLWNFDETLQMANKHEISFESLIVS